MLDQVQHALIFKQYIVHGNLLNLNVHIVIKISHVTLLQLLYFKNKYYLYSSTHQACQSQSNINPATHLNYTLTWMIHVLTLGHRELYALGGFNYANVSSCKTTTISEITTLKYNHQRRRFTLYLKLDQDHSFFVYIFTDLKLCLAHANHSFKSVKIILICQIGGHIFFFNLQLRKIFHI